jgi:multiple antibiotic resistance protein
LPLIGGRGDDAGMRELLSFALVTFSAIFFVVDPLAVIPLFLSITQGDTVQKKHATAAKAALVTTVTLLAFAVAGNFIFRLFGITSGPSRSPAASCCS